jgi:hypothetical protein
MARFSKNTTYQRCQKKQKTECLISSKETEVISNTTPTKKTPGLDGFTTEFLHMVKEKQSLPENKKRRNIPEHFV